MTTNVIELIGNPRTGSRTRALADTVTRELLARLAARGIVLPAATTLELSEVVAVSFSPDAPARVSTTIPDPFGLVRAAKLLVVATPTYKGSYTGLLKIFLDQFKPSDLAGTVAVGVAIAAGDDHVRDVSTALDAVLIAVGAKVRAVTLALHESRLADADGAVSEWIDKHIDALADALDPAT